MIRKQKSKILVFLLMLGLLYGCKRHLLDPLNPQIQLPPKVQLDKVKGFYEKGRYKNQPKRTSGNERMTAQDSARFKDFEPEWDKTEVELLPNNEKMLIVPVVRFLNVTYNKNLGFIRRLCIRVDANDDFLEANIVELIGNLTFVKENHNVIFKNYKGNNIAGFSGVISVYELDYTVIIRRAYSLSNFTKNVITEDVHVDDLGATDLTDVTPCILIIYGYPDANGNGGATVIIDFCDGTTTTSGGSSGGGGSGTGTGTTGTTGNTGSSGVYIPYIQPTIPRPPKRCELPPVVTTVPVVVTTVSPPPRDLGVSWAYTLYGDTQATPEEEALLRSIDSLSDGLGAVDKAGQMSPENKLLLATTLRELRNSSPVYEKMYQALRAEAQKPDPHRRSLVFKIRPVGAFGQGSFLITPGSPDLNEISIKATSLRDASVVGEEFLHALDTMVIRKNDPDVNNPNRVNYEFNVKVAMMMIARRDDGPEPHSLWQDYDVNGNIINPTIEQMRDQVEMKLWLNFLNPFPQTQFSAYDLNRYLYFANRFQNRQQPRYNFPAPATLEQPKILFFLLRP